MTRTPVGGVISPPTEEDGCRGGGRKARDGAAGRRSLDAAAGLLEADPGWLTRCLEPGRLDRGRREADPGGNRDGGGQAARRACLLESGLGMAASATALRVCVCLCLGSWAWLRFRYLAKFVGLVGCAAVRDGRVCWLLGYKLTWAENEDLPCKIREYCR